MYRFGIEISEELKKNGYYNFYSPNQEATVEVQLYNEDGEWNDKWSVIMSRHCGIGRGCFWTEWEIIGTIDDL